MAVVLPRSGPASLWRSKIPSVLSVRNPRMEVTDTKKSINPTRRQTDQFAFLTAIISPRSQTIGEKIYRYPSPKRKSPTLERYFPTVDASRVERNMRIASPRSTPEATIFWNSTVPRNEVWCEDFRFAIDCKNYREKDESYKFSVSCFQFDTRMNERFLWKNLF